MNVWGNKIKVTIFGESHGAAIGAAVDGIRSGMKVDTEFIAREMLRRAPGRNRFSTKRNEKDSVEIVSGVFDGYTTGTPICGIIKNGDTRSSDYEKDLIRPGHADYTAFVKYGEHRDFRGGGHFSGRITAPLVFAGALAKQQLAERGVTIGSHILSIGSVREKSFLDSEISAETLKMLAEKEFSVLDDEIGEKMKNEIIAAANDKDSAGGVIECAVIGYDKGKGSPFFGSVESVISSLVFSVPAVKGIEFGRGFALSEMRGSAANDEFFTDGTDVFTKTNNNGGINGGITNGMPIIFSAAVKPTPSIAKEQNTVDISEMKNAKIGIKGRHDPCIVQRAAVVIEACTALALLEMN